MANPLKRNRKKAGSPPGTVVFVGEQKTEQMHIAVMDYTATHLDEREVADVGQLAPLRDLTTTTWINVTGIHDTDMLAAFGSHFGIHPLTLEDIANTRQRPKAEEFDDYLYVVLKMLHPDEGRGKIGAEQVSLILGPHFLISFQEAPGDAFDPVRERIRKGKGRIRTGGCDYLAYALVDAVVDHYFSILEVLGEQVESVEDDLLWQEPDKRTLQTIHQLRRQTLFLRKQIWPLREVISLLRKDEFERIQSSTHPFLADVYDHVIQVLDTIESYRDMLGGMLDLYLSTLSNRMNEVMKVLTIIATIFIPITFIAGIYGMNFEYMPELHWHWGYFGVWGVIAATVIAMLLYFKRKKWL